MVNADDRCVLLDDDEVLMDCRARVVHSFNGIVVDDTLLLFVMLPLLLL